MIKEPTAKKLNPIKNKDIEETYKLLMALFTALPIIQFKPEWISENGWLGSMTCGDNSLTVENCDLKRGIINEDSLAVSFLDIKNRFGVFLRNKKYSVAIFEGQLVSSKKILPKKKCVLAVSSGEMLIELMYDWVSEGNSMDDYCSNSVSPLDVKRFYKILSYFPINVEKKGTDFFITIKET